jgi:hypothetical protein
MGNDGLHGSTIIERWGSGETRIGVFWIASGITLLFTTIKEGKGIELHPTISFPAFHQNILQVEVNFDSWM